MIEDIVPIDIKDTIEDYGEAEPYRTEQDWISGVCVYQPYLYLASMRLMFSWILRCRFSFISLR